MLAWPVGKRETHAPATPAQPVFVTEFRNETLETPGDDVKEPTALFFNRVLVAIRAGRSLRRDFTGNGLGIDKACVSQIEITKPDTGNIGTLVPQIFALVYNRSGEFFCQDDQAVPAGRAGRKWCAKNILKRLFQRLAVALPGVMLQIRALSR